jgi:hypothetical protein
MNHVPAAVARNTNTVAEGDSIMMTKEQLQEALEEVSADLEKLSNREKPLTKEEKKYRGKLLMRRNVLESIKEAKEKNQKSEELYNSTVYSLLVPWGEKHPVLMFFVMRLMRARWWGMSSYALREPVEREEK